MNSNQMRGKAIDAFNSFAGTADLYAVERMPRTYAGRPFLLTYLLGTGTKIRCPFSWPQYVPITKSCLTLPVSTGIVTTNEWP